MIDLATLPKVAGYSWAHDPSTNHCALLYRGGQLVGQVWSNGDWLEMVGPTRHRKVAMGAQGAAAALLAALGVQP